MNNWDSPQSKSTRGPASGVRLVRGDELGETPLFEAASAGSVDVVAALLVHRADPNLRRGRRRWLDWWVGLVVGGGWWWLVVVLRSFLFLFEICAYESQGFKYWCLSGLPMYLASRAKASDHKSPIQTTKRETRIRGRELRGSPGKAG